MQAQRDARPVARRVDGDKTAWEPASQPGAGPTAMQIDSGIQASRPAARPLQAMHLPVPDRLRQDVRALVGVELDRTGPVALAVAPHEAMVLTVQFGRGPDAIEIKGAPGENTSLTGIRQCSPAAVTA